MQVSVVDRAVLGCLQEQGLVVVVVVVDLVVVDLVVG